MSLALLVLTESGNSSPGAPTSFAAARDGNRASLEPYVLDGSQRRAVRRLAGLGYPVRCGGGTRPLVALTFDDGPGPLTRRTLALLRSEGVRSTFFLVGKLLDAWPDLEGVPRRTARWHAIGAHGWNHVSLVGLPAAELHHEVEDTTNAVRAAVERPVLLFRPPYGAHDPAVDRAIVDTGTLQVLWSVDSGDSVATTSEDVLRTVTEGLRPGAIVLLHENRGTTLRALPAILEAVRANGLHPVTVPELLAVDPPSPTQLRAGSCS